jgi:hypothetical protein
MVTHGALTIPGEDILKEPSIPINSTPGDGISQLQSVGFRILGFLKLFISGIALIYLVLIGVYMIVYSETEDKIKAQRKQITYALIGFLFLNIPGAIYTVFLPSEKNGNIISTDPLWQNTDSGTVFWDTYGFDWVFGWIIAFFRVFIFGVAVVMFTWGLFRMIVSAGNEEAQKQWKNRLIYGTIALIFLGFVEFWGRLVADGDFDNYIPFIANRLFGIAVFFAAPVAVFFLIWWAYYYITSAGDEDRIKKWKNILINTFIATLILIAGLSFLSDLVTFRL